MTLQLIVDSHSEADQVIEAAEQLIKKYDYLSMNDLLELVGQVGRYDQEKIGWTDVKNVVVGRTNDGLSTTVTFPAPSPLDI